MQHCEKCAKIVFESDGEPSQEQLEKMGNPEAAKWCEICKQLMLANYRLRRDAESIPLKPINSSHSDLEGSFTRFDVK